MTSYFLDVNTWLALAWEGHVHHRTAASWFRGIARPSRFLFSRYSQLGLLRLTTNTQVMGGSVLNLKGAFAVYDEFLSDPRVVLREEPDGLEPSMRALAGRYARRAVTKVIGDLYLMAFAVTAEATLVTFDKALARALRTRRSPVVLLG
jgi:toxin-antitoxin system PIN domain toxin